MSAPKIRLSGGAQRWSVGLGLVGLALATSSAAHAEDAPLGVRFPAQRLYVGATVEGLVVEARGASPPDSVRIVGLEPSGPFRLEDGRAALPEVVIRADTLRLESGRLPVTVDVPQISGFWSLMPALLAVVLALVTRQVLLSLAGGILFGTFILHGPSLVAFPRALDVVIAGLIDPDHVKLVFFTLLMGGLVGVIASSGGAKGIVAAVSRRARGARSGQLSTWILGLFIFFDDYASSLLIGSTMRPLTDRLRISREKLAYIVDSTSAPISSLAVVSTWIGYEVSVLSDALETAGIDRDAYALFIEGLPSRFYPILALGFVGLVAWSGRDFGPMLRAERRARMQGSVLRPGARPLLDTSVVDDQARLERVPGRAWLAVVPIVVLLATVLAVLASTGGAAAADDPEGWAAAQAQGVTRMLGYLLGHAASYDALIYGSGAGLATAIGGAVAAGSLSVNDAIDAFVRGLKSMVLAILVLALAWGIGGIMGDLKAGAYVAEALGDSVPVWALPTLTFVLASLTAFATGTSWGTMAILFPITMPLVALHAGSPGFENGLLGTSSAVLAGAVFGDHCSPISDTTVLSSVASGSDHVDHVRTQAPYALVVGAVSITLGTLPYGLGAPAVVCLGVGMATLVALLFVLGSVVPDAVPRSEPGVAAPATEGDTVPAGTEGPR